MTYEDTPDGRISDKPAFVLALSEKQETKESFSKRGCSSVGRAPALQAGGQEFESLHLHQDERSSEKDGHKTKGKHTDTGS